MSEIGKFDIVASTLDPVLVGQVWSERQFVSRLRIPGFIIRFSHGKEEFIPEEMLRLLVKYQPLDEVVR